MMKRLERLEYDGWNDVSFRDLQEGDIIRAKGEPKKAWAIQTPPLQISYRYTEEFFSFYGDSFSPMNCWV